MEKSGAGALTIMFKDFIFLFGKLLSDAWVTNLYSKYNSKDIFSSSNFTFQMTLNRPILSVKINMVERNVFLCVCSSLSLSLCVCVCVCVCVCEGGWKKLSL